ncbi:MAG TPA: FAD-dependent oxidoreductase [Acidimicrobiales bacterium]|nr:FAD-dependent oxidoreductase [Acidimicrobiales bacterium]
MRRCDVVVVGAGVMGAAVAWELSRRGTHVVTVEQFEYLHTRGSSHGATRTFRLADRDPALVRLAAEALPLWRALEEDAEKEVLVTTGGVDHGDVEELRAIAATLDGAGVRYDVLQAEVAAERWPGMRFVGPVVYQRDGGRLLSEQALRAFTEAAASHGAEVYYSQPVHEIEVLDEADGGDVVVVTDFDEYIAPVVVVAAGAWADKLVDGLASAPPLTVTQEQTFHFLPRRDDMAWPSFVHYGEPARYGLETPDEGVKVAEHGTGAVVDPDERDNEIDPLGEQRVVDYVEEWLPGLETWATTATTCLYATAPDNAFVVERHGPIVVAAGFSGHGFKHAPAIARRIAALVQD